MKSEKQKAIEYAWYEKEQTIKLARKEYYALRKAVRLAKIKFDETKKVAELKWNQQRKQIDKEFLNE